MVPSDLIHRVDGFNGYDRDLKSTQTGLALQIERVSREVTLLAADVKAKGR